ncbi:MULTISPECIES: MMPL family transporter [Pseudonocardia]|uniref:Membrane protein YdfJ n=2 Tax=Pseudonocardia TaxID=1847 RepID=A0A1Y2N7N8_PSEAH|nr:MULTISPECIES: MMPL family transporter [Pseudonocardia]OSY43097.1 Membrane protein YdfJ [Pseudonocardia autotrophica]TDN71585.1 RND superfamily putative drug exporter [Pseudonocardia autotrophica]BBG02273.1 hypothetical protein Pdca_34820 [Pseudonocardia autotrophica]GEC23391.1 hypothetical protein PSA01_04200 [Pseudonocardia saturnea]
MDRLSRAVLARPGRTTALLTVLFLAGCASIALLLPRVSETNEYPALAGYRANEAIRDVVGTGGYERPVIGVVTLAPGQYPDDPATAAAVGDAYAAAGRAVGARVLSPIDAPSQATRSADGRVLAGLFSGAPVEQGGLPGSALGEGPGLETAVYAAMTPLLPPGAELRVTGLDALATGVDTGGLNAPVKLAVTVGAALVVLVWVFRSRLAVVPLVVAAVATPVAFLGLLLVSPLITVHETTVIMLPLLGVGLAVDYALIVVARWREERASALPGEPRSAAVHRTMATSGRAVLTSTAAVAFGLATMIVLPIPLLRSLGVGGMLVTLASALVTLLLLPVLLARMPDPAPERIVAGPGWARWTRFVVRHRVPAAASAGGLLLGLCAVATGINLHLPASPDLAATGPGRDGLNALQTAGLPTGLLSGFDVFVPPGADPAAVARHLASVPGVAAAIAPDGDEWRAAAGSVLTVLPHDEAGTGAGRATVQAVRDAAPSGVQVGGNATQQLDYLDATYGTFPLMLALVGLVTLVVLTRALRSVLLALKAVLFCLLSLGAVLGALVLLWQWGWGTEALLGITPDGAIGTFVPVTVFAFLYGLTTDYEVFLLSRVREARDAGMDTTEALVEGLGRSGRVVGYAALILFFSFAAMAGGGELDVAIFASGVALGILIDATLIRAVLLPAGVALLGSWNWWLPAPAARLLGVAPAPRRTGE